MTLNREDIAAIAHLARLGCNDDELDRYAAELSHILQLVEQMQQTPTDNIEPLAHPLDMVQRLREDAVTEVNERSALMQPAPLAQDGLYLVPKVIDDGA